MAGTINKIVRKKGKLIAVDVTVGACSTCYSLMDQVGKIREEVGEVVDALVKYDKATEVQSVKAKWDVLEECCDTVTAVFTLMNMLGFDAWNICEMMEEVRKKNIKRGYLK